MGIEAKKLIKGTPLKLEGDWDANSRGVILLEEFIDFSILRKNNKSLDLALMCLQRKNII